MSKKDNVIVDENTASVNPEVVGEEGAANAAPQVEDNAPVEQAVVEKDGFFKKIKKKVKKTKKKISKAYNEGITLPPIKTVVKTIGVAAAGAAAAVLVIAKLNGGSEYDDSYALETSNDEEPEFEATFEEEASTEE